MIEQGNPAFGEAAGMRKLLSLLLLLCVLGPAASAETTAEWARAVLASAERNEALLANLDKLALARGGPDLEPATEAIKAYLPAFHDHLTFVQDVRRDRKDLSPSLFLSLNGMQQAQDLRFSSLIAAIYAQHVLANPNRPRPRGGPVLTKGSEGIWDLYSGLDKKDLPELIRQSASDCGKQAKRYAEQLKLAQGEIK